MRVLHIGKYFPPYTGGMETFLRDVMAALSRRGVDNEALVHQSGISLRSTEELHQGGNQPLRVTRAAVWARFFFTPISPTFPLLLCRLIRRLQPDILHLHMPNVSAFWVLLLPGARRIPWIVQWQSDVLASEHSRALRLFYTVYRPFERAILRRCHAVIVATPPYLESSAPLRDFRAKCHVIPLGLDPAGFPSPVPASPAPISSDTPLRVLAVGRLTYYKGFEYLLRALAQLDDVVLTLVGRGDQERELRSLAAALDLDRVVRFRGRLTDEQLAREFAECDCLCLPSIERTEAFGMVLLEAMYFGKATIVTDVPGSGMGWIVEHDVTGIRIAPGSADAIAGALRHLQLNRDKMTRLGENGSDKFARDFHIDNCAAGVGEVYQATLETT